MPPMLESFVLHFGEMGSRWGVNRTVGQIYALLMMHEQPLDAEQIMAELRISRGNVSMGLKELQAWRLIRVQHLPGERREFYTVAGEIWDMGLRIVEERRKRELEPTLTLLRGLLMEHADSDQDRFAQARMQEIHDLLEMISRWSQELQTLRPEKLRSLMKLGAGIGKVLDMKNRLAGNRTQGSSDNDPT